MYTYTVEGWPAILCQADGDDRSGVNRSNEPAYIYEADGWNDLTEGVTPCERS